MKRAGIGWLTWRHVGLGLLGLSLALGLLPALRTTPPPAVVLTPPTHLPQSFRDRIVGHLPAGSAWVGRLEKVLFGDRRPIDLEFEFFRLNAAILSNQPAMALGPPTFSDSTNLQVWLLDADDLPGLRVRLLAASTQCGPRATPALLDRTHRPAAWTPALAGAAGVVPSGVRPERWVLAKGEPIGSLFSPRVRAADGVSCRLRQSQMVQIDGTPLQTGLTLDCETRVHPRSTDLIAAFQLTQLSPVALPPLHASAVTDSTRSSELSLIQLPADTHPVQTNLNLTLRLRIPKTQGVLILSQSVSDPSSSVGIVLDVRHPKGK